MVGYNNRYRGSDIEPSPKLSEARSAVVRVPCSGNHGMSVMVSQNDDPNEYTFEIVRYIKAVHKRGTPS